MIARAERILQAAEAIAVARRRTTSNQVNITKKHDMSLAGGGFDDEHVAFLQIDAVVLAGHCRAIVATATMKQNREESGQLRGIDTRYMSFLCLSPRKLDRKPPS